MALTAALITLGRKVIIDQKIWRGASERLYSGNVALPGTTDLAAQRKDLYASIYL
jgi:hypothetical protein